MDEWLLVTNPAASSPPPMPTVESEAAAVALRSSELASQTSALVRAKAARAAAGLAVVSRSREIEEINLQIEATETQLGAVHREHDWCLGRLASLRSQAEAYATTLRQKQQELFAVSQQLDVVGKEVTAAQSRIAAQLDEAQGLNAALATAREEVTSPTEHAPPCMHLCAHMHMHTLMHMHMHMHTRTTAYAHMHGCRCAPSRRRSRCCYSRSMWSPSSRHR